MAVSRRPSRRRCRRRRRPSADEATTKTTWDFSSGRTFPPLGWIYPNDDGDRPCSRAPFTSAPRSPRPQGRSSIIVPRPSTSST